MTPRRVPAWTGAARQQGVALIVGMIMLVIITLVILGAYSLTTSNFKSVANMQVREEAIAAANHSIERLITSNFTTAMATQTYTVDINNDGTVDYNVNMAIPVCLRAIKASDAKPSDAELGPEMSSGVDWFTDWDIEARVTDPVTGADVRVRQGVRVMLNQTQKSTVCP
jgi:Tfp pilus assembly protein PilV